MDLHALIENEDLDGLAEALAAGADVDARSPTDATPLYAAMDAKSLPMVKLLLAHGADPNAIQEDRSRRDRDQRWIQRLEEDGDDTTRAHALALDRSSPRTVLSAAAALFGNAALMQCLLDAGARTDVTDPRGWTPLHFAAHGRGEADVMALLVSAGVDLHARTEDGYTALALCCRDWRASGTLRLMELGAPLSDIGWTELHLGALNDELPSPRDPSVDLEAVDIYGRTALHIAFQHRNESVIHELLDLGADPRTPHPQKGTLLRMALSHAAPELLDRLLAVVDVNEKSTSFEDTALMANLDNHSHVRRLLDAGADPNLRNRFGDLAFQLEYNGSLTVLTMLRPGSDWSPLKAEARAKVFGDPELELVAPPDQRHRWHVCGDQNPTDMTNPWWVSLVRTRTAACFADDVFEDEVRDGPIWCAERFGQSLTRLPDDTFVEIGGEHEDWYDRNFCIYNDVIVHHPDGSVQIFGYPPYVFPPTDNHSATLVGDHIYVVGNLGYGRDRVSGFTPVYRLTLGTWEMEEVVCTGDSPGWVRNHEAALVDGCIEVSGGKLILPDLEDVRAKDDDRDDANHHTYRLDLSTRVWSRVD